MTTLTPGQRRTMLDRAEHGGQNRADAERLLDTTLRDAGPNTLGPRLYYEGFGAIPPPETRACGACGATIEALPDVGWVDVRSGDDGGTYDYCPERDAFASDGTVAESGGHRP